MFKTWFGFGEVGFRHGNDGFGLNPYPNAGEVINLYGLGISDYLRRCSLLFGGCGRWLGWSDLNGRDVLGFWGWTVTDYGQTQLGGR